MVMIPAWIDRVDWNRGSLSCTVGKDLIEGSPAYSPARQMSTDFERALLAYDHHKH